MSKVAGFLSPLATDETSAEEYLVGFRWPAGVLCPKCGAADPSVRSQDPPLKWRCRSCRRDFTTTTDTAMHRSKIGLAKWLAAIWSWDTRPPVLARELGISAPTSRRIAAALEMTEQPPGEGRLAVLLTQHHDLTEAMRARLPATLQPEDNPIADLTSGQRTVMAVLRNRPRGAEAEQIASASGLTVEHTASCLEALSRRGYTCCKEASVAWGYGSLTVPLWSLDLNDECILALAFLPRRPDPVDRSLPEQIPPEFWWLFWSGSHAGDLRLPEDAFQVACTLLDGPDRAAREWALRCLPVEALQRCRGMRGYDIDPLASVIDAAILERTIA